MYLKVRVNVRSKQQCIIEGAKEQQGKCKRPNLFAHRDRLLSCKHWSGLSGMLFDVRISLSSVHGYFPKLQRASFFKTSCFRMCLIVFPLLGQAGKKQDLFEADSGLGSQLIEWLSCGKVKNQWCRAIQDRFVM